MFSMPGQSYRGPLPAATATQQDLAIHLRRHVHALAVEIGPRHLRRGSSLERAAQYIEGEFKALGYEVESQPYEVDGRTTRNLIAELKGGARAGEIFVAGAHYDSCGDVPAANDNGSGVAALLELARILKDSKPERTIRFVAFTNEEPPYYHSRKMGSVVYARRCSERKENLVGMFALETIGYYTDTPNSQQYPALIGMLYPSTGNFISFVGNFDSRHLVKRTVELFRKTTQFPSEGGAVPDVIEGIGWSDHWSFWQEGYPALMVTDTAIFRYPYYHTREDTIDKLDFDRMARVVEGLGTVLRSVSSL